MKKINDTNFSQVIKNCKKPIVIKFYNPTCHLCVGLEPVFERLTTMFDNYEFAECSAVDSRNLFKFFDISGVPSLFIVGKDYKKEIPYPQHPDPESGFSIYDMADFLDTFKP
ncbi:MAG: hypothetical protein EBS86_17325 [Crocinitomicaceae bacterium]|jgi:hypothetical protein|nr:hypothetical protein [Crocinitomicaceae bacterium]